MEFAFQEGESRFWGHLDQVLEDLGELVAALPLRLPATEARRGFWAQRL